MAGAATLSIFGHERVDRVRSPVLHLLSLPAEIRLSIYEAAFSYDSFEAVDASKALAPLLTCRQIYNEASTLAFSLTQFKLELKQVLELPTLLCRLRPSRRKSIAQLNILIIYPSYHELRPEDLSNFWLELDREGLPSLALDTLTITVRVAEPSSPWAHFYSDLMASDRVIDHELSTVWNDFVRHWLNQVTANKINLVSLTSDVAAIFMMVHRTRVDADVWEFTADTEAAHDHDFLKENTFTLIRRKPTKFSRA